MSDTPMIPGTFGDVIAYNRRARVLRQIDEERSSQDARWGEQNHDNGTGGPQWQAAADGAKRIYEDHVVTGTVTYLDVLREEVYEAFAESEPDKLRAELLQVAAVAACWVEKLDRDRVTERVKALLDAGASQGLINLTDDGYDRRPYPEDH